MKPERQMNRKYFSEAIVEFCLSTTAHGLPNIARTTRSFMRFMWTLFVLLYVAMCGYLIYTLIIGYLEFEVVTKIRTHSEPEMTFPTVTICNQNYFTTNEAKKFLNEVYAQDNEYNFTTSDSVKDVERLEDFFYRSLYAATKEPPERMLKFGYSLGEMFIVCKIADMYEKCSEKFVYVYNNFYGNCFSFNINGTFKVGSTSFSSLEIELFIGIEEGVEGFLTSKKTGAVVFVSNSSLSPRTFTNGIQIAANTNTWVSMKRIFSEKLPSPYSNCKMDLSTAYPLRPSVYNKMRQLNVTYRQQDCIDINLGEVTLQRCDCGSPLVEPKFAGDKPICSDKNQSDCSEDTLMYFFEKDNYLKYIAQCPIECNTMSFDFTVTQTTFPSADYLKLLRRHPKITSKFKLGVNITDAQIAASILSINLFYADMSYTLRSEIPEQSPISLISNVGGTLGLFLGVSLLSFVELVELVIELVLIYFENQNRVMDLGRTQAGHNIAEPRKNRR